MRSAGHGVEEREGMRRRRWTLAGRLDQRRTNAEIGKVASQAAETVSARKDLMGRLHALTQKVQERVRAILRRKEETARKQKTSRRKGVRI